MRLDSSGISTDGRSVTHVRLDKIGAAGDGLWWVAEAFADGSTKPEGMFTSREQASSLAQELAEKWGVDVRVTELADS